MELFQKLVPGGILGLLTDQVDQMALDWRPPHPNHRNGSRGEVGWTSWSARPPARRCAVAAGGLIPSGWGSGGV
jgi:hypothetical protein